MSNVQFLLLVGGIIVGVYMVLTVAISARSMAEDEFRRVARRLGCGFQSGGLFELPTLKPVLRGLTGVLTLREGKEELTALSLPVPAYRGGTLGISTDTLGGMFLRLFGVKDLRIGDAGFDEDYVVEAFPESVAHGFFAAPRRVQVIETIRRLSRFGGVRIKVRPGHLDVEVRNCLREETGLRTFLQCAEEILGYMVTPSEEGIQWGESRLLTGTCPVCSTALCEPVWRCDRCAAPHHRDCRDYLGRCAVYGCEPRPRRRAA